ncbi:MAG: N-acetylglucosamine-6-phosphate deacetylase [Bacillota bacterium]
MSQLALTKVTVLTPFNLLEEATILIDGPKIVAVGSPDAVEIPSEFRRVPLEGLAIAPGFIDQHLHGGGGADVMDGSVECLIETARFHAAHGTTSFLATAAAGTKEQLVKVARAFAALKDTDYKGARCLGLHLEGPYISLKYPGALPAATIRQPSIGEILTLQQISHAGIKLLTLAPEIPGALDLASSLQSEGIICSIGHSDADYEISLDAIAAGFKGVTHCFNQLHSFHHRDPGVIGAALTKPELSVELIVDGIHLHKSVVDIIWRAKGPEGIILVSDATLPAGLLDGQYQTAAGGLVLNKGKLINEDGKLAGSVVTLEQAVKNFLKFTGCSLTEAFQMATYNPARFLGINKRKGSLYPGKDADLVIMTTDLEVVATMVNGEIISGLISLD